MVIALMPGEEASLKAFLAACPDAEMLSEREWVVDLYDLEKPLSLDLVFVKRGVAVDGAAELLYDEEQDGWYMGERIEDPEQVRNALAQAGALAG